MYVCVRVCMCEYVVWVCVCMCMSVCMLCVCVWVTELVCCVCVCVRVWVSMLCVCMCVWVSGEGNERGRSKWKQSRQGDAKQCKGTLNLILINWYWFLLWFLVFYVILTKCQDDFNSDSKFISCCAVPFYRCESRTYWTERARTVQYCTVPCCRWVADMQMKRQTNVMR